MGRWSDLALAKELGYRKPRYVIDDTDIGLIVKYIGSQASGTVTVTVTTGDITFKHGVLASEVVDPTIDSGGDDDGVIDVSDANANTFGEVVDLINASPNWEAFLVDALRADASTPGQLLTKSATQAKLAYGIKLFKDTSACLNLSVLLNPIAFEAELGEYGVPFDTYYNSFVTQLFAILSLNTYGSGTSKIQIYEIDIDDDTESKIAEWAGGATTVAQLDNWFKDIDGMKSSIGKAFLVRMIGSAACTGSLGVFGGAYCPSGLY